MGLFKILFGSKNRQTEKDQTVNDYIRVGLLAKLGEENLGNGNFYEAITYIKEFIQLMNKNSFSDLQHLYRPCFFNIALAYSNLDDHTNAVLYWTKFINIDRSNLNAYIERYRSLFELNRLDEAVSDINFAIKLKPNRDDLYINKGIVNIKLKNISEAKKALLKAKELGNKDAEHYLKNFCN